MIQTVGIGELTDLGVRLFRRHGLSGESIEPVAEMVVAAEREGATGHNLLRRRGSRR